MELEAASAIEAALELSAETTLSTVPVDVPTTELEA